jgi:hypothetical protein
VTVRAKAECEKKMTDLLKAAGISLERKEVVERAYVARKSEGEGAGSGNQGGTGDDDNEEL